MLNYQELLDKIKGRRYSDENGKYVTSNWFANGDYHESVTYVLACMESLDEYYGLETYSKASQLTNGLKTYLQEKAIEVEFRQQGNLKINTNVDLYGSIELIIILNRISDKPHSDVFALRNELTTFLSSFPGVKRVSIKDGARIQVEFNKDRGIISVLPSYWVDYPRYKETKNEMFRGIAEINFDEKKITKYPTFFEQACYKQKNDILDDCLSAYTRLFISLIRDCTPDMLLTNREIHALSYSIPEEDLTTNSKIKLDVMDNVVKFLKEASSSQEMCEKIISPSGQHVFLGKPEKLKAIVKFNDLFQEVASDVAKHLSDTKSID